MDDLAPYKVTTKKQDKSAHLFNVSTRKVKQSSRRLEGIWRSSKTALSYAALQDSYRSHKKALRVSRTTYYSALLNANKNNPQFLFSTIAKLTRNHNCVKPCIPIGLSSNDLRIFFLHKIANIRNERSILSSSTGPMEEQPKHGNTNIHLESFQQIGLSVLNSLISSAKSTTSLLDPPPTKLLKEVSPLLSVVLRIIN